MIHYPVPPHLQPAYAALCLETGAFPITESLHHEVLSLPIGPTQTDTDTLRVVVAVHNAARTLAAA